MPKFLTIGYGDRARYDRTPQTVKEAAPRVPCAAARGVVEAWPLE